MVDASANVQGDDILYVDNNVLNSKHPDSQADPIDHISLPGDPATA
jgi:hypothetical protein